MHIPRLSSGVPAIAALMIVGGKTKRSHRLVAKFTMHPLLYKGLKVIESLSRVKLTASQSAHHCARRSMQVSSKRGTASPALSSL